MQHSHQLRAAMGRLRALRIWRTWVEDAVRTRGTHENIDCHRRRLGGRAKQQTRTVQPAPRGGAGRPGRGAPETATTHHPQGVTGNSG